jgi:hypothetical protein
MKGHGFKNTVAENIFALKSHLSSERRFAKHKAMCWRCQKDKHRAGGYVKTYPGLCKFICADCLAEIEVKKKTKEQTKQSIPDVPQPKAS